MRGVPGFLLVVSCVAALSAHQPQPEELRRSLDLAATYLEQYERDVTAITAREHYVQALPAEARSRTIRSNLVFVPDPSEGWVEYRDIYEVDGSTIHDQQDRILRLFMQPTPDARLQARRIADESARFNLSPRTMPFQITTNVPLTALRFLRRNNQARSAWRLERGERIGPLQASVVRFEEQAKPRLIGARQQRPAKGRFWIDAVSGAVLRSEVELEEAPLAATIRVTYSLSPTLKVRLPTLMQESYGFRSQYGINTQFEGRATYSDFRQFTVETSTLVK